MTRVLLKVGTPILNSLFSPPISLLPSRLQPRKSPFTYSSDYVLRVIHLLRSHLLQVKLPAQYLQLSLPPRSPSPTGSAQLPSSKTQLRSADTGPSRCSPPAAQQHCPRPVHLTFCLWKHSHMQFCSVSPSAPRARQGQGLFSLILVFSVPILHPGL